MRMTCVVALVVCSACVPSAAYHPGPHSFATLERRGDVYLGVHRGSVPSSVSFSPQTVDLQGAIAVSDRYTALVRGYRAEGERTTVREHLRHSGLEVGVGTLTRRRGAWLVQDLLAIGRATSDAALSSQVDGEGWPAHRAQGRYTRAYLQRSLVRRGVIFDVGGSARLSTVYFDRFSRNAPVTPTGPPFVLSYSQAMPDTGSRFGVFLEPSLMFRVGYRNVKVGPEISMAYRAFKTAFETQAVSVGFGLAVNIEPQGRK
jgi:hypothetical protein